MAMRKLSSLPLKRLASRLGALRGDTAGSTAVEFAFVGLAFVTVFLGLFQFSLAFMAQMYIHDAVSEAATGQTTSTYAGNRSAVVNQICARMIAVENCTANMRVEAQPLANYATSAQAISGGTFTAATANTLMMIRAQAPVVTFLPGFPTLQVKAAAIYRRV